MIQKQKYYNYGKLSSNETSIKQSRQRVIIIKFIVIKQKLEYQVVNIPPQLNQFSFQSEENKLNSQEELHKIESNNIERDEQLKNDLSQNIIKELQQEIQKNEEIKQIDRIDQQLIIGVNILNDKKQSSQLDLSNEKSQGPDQANHLNEEKIQKEQLEELQELQEQEKKIDQEDQNVHQEQQQSQQEHVINEIQQLFQNESKEEKFQSEEIVEDNRQCEENSMNKEVEQISQQNNQQLNESNSKKSIMSPDSIDEEIKKIYNNSSCSSSNIEEEIRQESSKEISDNFQKYNKLPQIIVRQSLLQQKFEVVYEKDCEQSIQELQSFVKVDQFNPEFGSFDEGPREKCPYRKLQGISESTKQKEQWFEYQKRGKFEIEQVGYFIFSSSDDEIEDI